MAKIYVKTIILVAAFTIFLLARLGQLVAQFPIPTPILNFLLFTIPVAIIINEKLTRGERWTGTHYALLGISALFFAYLCFVIF